MTKVNLRYFASVREALDATREEADIRGGTVSDVLQWLVASHGDKLIPMVFDPKKKLRGEYRVLHNGSVCLPASMAKERVADGDEIVIMPPVAGG